MEYLPLIPANNWNNTIEPSFQSKLWLDQGFATLNLSSLESKRGFETDYVTP
jgi:iron complex outermembrane receptor protein